MKKINQIFRDFWKSSYRWPVLFIVLMAFIFGFLSRGGPSDDRSVPQHIDLSEQNTEKIEMWTCSMHPQIKQSKLGKCPICAMDLVPIKQCDSGGQGVRELKLSDRAIKLAGIQISSVKRQYVSAKIRLVGKVVYDETRLKDITARVPGRVDRLYVDYTGIQVKKGDHLVSLYSPQLITAQQELLEARILSSQTLEIVREKLHLWGLTGKQIKEIEKRGKARDHLTIYSPSGGIVVQKNVSEGKYVNTGTRIYTIADLSRVWVKLDAYESDLPRIRYGQRVEFETEAFPGEIFAGKIAFIDPVLNQQTRTVKVRINVLNADRRLKPEMFVRALIHSKVSATGKVMDEDLMGKWISPMHPEIVKDGPGKCDICGMPLVLAEKLGYVNKKSEDEETPLVIPASAPLLTGTRAVVYIKLPDKEGSFEGREVKLGPRAGDFYIVKEGLREGDLVVVNGAFKLDSDLQIQAKPSMMNPEGGVPVSTHHHHIEEQEQNVTGSDSIGEVKKDQKKPAQKKDIPIVFKKSIGKLTATYLDVQRALSQDNFKMAKEKSKTIADQLKNTDMNLLSGRTHNQWMKIRREIEKSIDAFNNASNINDTRTFFASISDQMTTIIKHFGVDAKKDIYLIHCPMALDNQGAFWLQDSTEVQNPYFGASMLKCHDSKEIIVPKKKK